MGTLLFPFRDAHTPKLSCNMISRLVRPNGALAHATRQLIVRQPYRCLSFSSNLQLNSQYKLVTSQNITTIRQLHTSHTRNDDKKKDDKNKKEAPEMPEPGPAGLIGMLIFMVGFMPYIIDKVKTG